MLGVPTVLRVDGFRVLILFPPREHPPPHVHVVNADGLVVIRLAQAGSVQRTLRREGMKASDVRRAETVVKQNAAYLLARWREIHGDKE